MIPRVLLRRSVEFCPDFKENSQKLFLQKISGYWCPEINCYPGHETRKSIYFQVSVPGSQLIFGSRDLEINWFLGLVTRESLWKKPNFVNFSAKIAMNISPWQKSSPVNQSIMLWPWQLNITVPDQNNSMHWGHDSILFILNSCKEPTTHVNKKCRFFIYLIYTLLIWQFTQAWNH